MSVDRGGFLNPSSAGVSNSPAVLARDSSMNPAGGANEGWGRVPPNPEGQGGGQWAVMYTRQVVGAWTTNKELVDAFFNAAYPIILQHAGENYILGRLFARIKEEKIGDLIGLK